MHYQQDIGWEQAFRGNLSSAWTHSQNLEHPKSTQQGIRTQWTKPVFLAMWQVHYKMWEHRNSVLHGKALPDLKDSSLEAKVRRLHDLQETFVISEQSPFQLPLAQRLRKLLLTTYFPRHHLKQNEQSARIDPWNIHPTFSNPRVLYLSPDPRMPGQGVATRFLVPQPR